MSFLDTIVSSLSIRPDRCSVTEIHGTDARLTKGNEILDLIRRARTFMAQSGVKPGDRVALLAPSSVKWVAVDLAALCGGAISVALYDRQNVSELAAIARRCEPGLVIASDQDLASKLREAWPEHGKVALYDEAFSGEPSAATVHDFAPGDVAAIMHTSGTDGVPKGVSLTSANLEYMLAKMSERLEQMAGSPSKLDRLFQFLPLCFATSRIMLWAQMMRPDPVMLSTDLGNLVEEMATANPRFLLTVPTVLERIRRGMGEAVRGGGGFASSMFESGSDAYRRVYLGKGSAMDRVRYSIAKGMVFTGVKHAFGPSLEFVISTSGELSDETRKWFEMIGIRVYQAYGLTETTGVVSLDRPGKVASGRVGYPLDDVETKLTDASELLVRGPNLFQGYWNDSGATEAVVRDGWLHTGDKVEIDEGSLRVVGRLASLFTTEAGVEIAPEPLEQRFLEACHTADQCMVVGQGRPFLSVLVVGPRDDEDILTALRSINEHVPENRQVIDFHLADEAFTRENGLLDDNHKLRRDAIAEHFADAIDGLYDERPWT